MWVRRILLLAFKYADSYTSYVLIFFSKLGSSFGKHWSEYSCTVLSSPQSAALGSSLWSCDREYCKQYLKLRRCYDRSLLATLAYVTSECGESVRRYYRSKYGVCSGWRYLRWRRYFTKSVAGADRQDLGCRIQKRRYVWIDCYFICTFKDILLLFQSDLELQPPLLFVLYMFLLLKRILTSTVWKMTETKWDQRGDPQLRGNYHQKIPKIQAMLNWELVNAVSLSLSAFLYSFFLFVFALSSSIREHYFSEKNIFVSTCLLFLYF